MPSATAPWAVLGRRGRVVSAGSDGTGSLDVLGASTSILLLNSNRVSSWHDPCLVKVTCRASSTS